VLAAAIVAAALVFPTAGLGWSDAARPAAPKPATASITAPDVGDITIARITLQAKPGVTIRPRLSVTNKASLDENLRVFGKVSKVPGKKGRFEAWVLAMSPEEQGAARAARSPLLGPITLGTGVPRGKLRAGAAGLDADVESNIFSDGTLQVICAAQYGRGFGAALALLAGELDPDLPDPSLQDDVCDYSERFVGAQIGPIEGAIDLGVGPHGTTTSPVRAEVDAPAGAGIFVTLRGPGAGAFVDDPDDSVSYAYRMLDVVGEEPFTNASTCGGVEIRAFGVYAAEGRIEVGAGEDIINGTLSVGPANDPVPDCPVSSTDQPPAEVKASWCYWSPTAGLFQLYVRGTPGSRIHAEIEGPPNSKGPGLSEASRTTRIPESGRIVFRTNLVQLGEYHIEVGNVFGKPTFEATVDTTDNPPPSPAPAGCPDVF
jgi:hypothetical protein